MFCTDIAFMAGQLSTSNQHGQTSKSNGQGRRQTNGGAGITLFFRGRDGNGRTSTFGGRDGNGRTAGASIRKGNAGDAGGAGIARGAFLGVAPDAGDAGEALGAWLAFGRVLDGKLDFQAGVASVALGANRTQRIVRSDAGDALHSMSRK